MTRIERLEAQQKALDAERKRINKALGAARRRETMKAAQAERAKEQAEAVAFMAFCRTAMMQGPDGQQFPVYDYVTALMAQQSEKVSEGGAEPGAAGSDESGEK